MKNWEKEFDFEFEVVHWRYGRNGENTNFDPNPVMIKNFIQSLLDDQRQGLWQAVSDIHTELHNGRMETAYEMTYKLLNKLEQ